MSQPTDYTQLPFWGFRFGDPPPQPPVPPAPRGNFLTGLCIILTILTLGLFLLIWIPLDLDGTRAHKKRMLEFGQYNLWYPEAYRQWSAAQAAGPR